MCLIKYIRSASYALDRSRVYLCSQTLRCNVRHRPLMFIISLNTHKTEKKKHKFEWRLESRGMLARLCKQAI